MMLNGTPFEWGINHLVQLTWPTIIVLVWRGFKFFSTIEAMVQKKSAQFDELHVAVTNHLTHAIPEAAEKVSAELAEHDQHEMVAYHELATAIHEEGRETRQLLASLLGGK